MLAAYALSLVATVIMLDQYRLASSSPSDVDDLADDDLNRSTLGIGMDLSRTSPTAIKQRLRRRHARLLRRTVSGDASQRLDAQFRVRPRQ